jgi:hypothetical protein
MHGSSKGDNHSQEADDHDLTCSRGGTYSPMYAHGTRFQRIGRDRAAEIATAVPLSLYHDGASSRMRERPEATRKTSGAYISMHQQRRWRQQRAVSSCRCSRRRCSRRRWLSTPPELPAARRNQEPSLQLVGYPITPSPDAFASGLGAGTNRPLRIFLIIS